MASPNFYASGIGGTTGAELATLVPLYTSGNVWYVKSGTGVDAAGNAGKERNKPLATLAQAHTNASAGDIIVFLASHSQTLTAVQVFDKAHLTILGEGSIAAGTGVTFARNANDEMFDVTAAGVQFVNLTLGPSATTSTTTALVRFAGAGGKLIGCYCRASTIDDGPILELITGADHFSMSKFTRSDGTVAQPTFISTATTVADQPDNAIEITNAISHLTMDSVIIDGAASGWAQPFAVNGAAAVTGLKATNMELLNDSDVNLATGTTGYIHVVRTSGSSRVVWAA
jgi:hypothetical protein